MSAVLSYRGTRPDPAVDATAGRPRERIGALDGLRGLAVAAVVAFHYWPGAVPGGYIGVSVFFTLSGYLIATLVRDEKARTGRVGLSAFWLRRVRRLLPAATMALAAVLALVALTHSDDLRRVAGDVLAATFYVANWRTAAEPGGYEALFDTAVRPVGHFWSLSIEEQFYLLGPLVLAARARWLLPGLASLTLVGIVVWWGSPDSYYATPVRIGEIGAGVGLAVLLARVRVPRRVGRIVGPPALLALIVIALSWTDTEPVLFRGGLMLIATLSALSVVGALGDGGFPRALSAGPLVWLGRRSYAVYLYHWPVLELTSWSPVVCLVVSLALAEVSWRLVERPILASRGVDRPILVVIGATVVLVAVALVILGVDDDSPPSTDALLAEVRDVDGAPPGRDVDGAPPGRDADGAEPGRDADGAPPGRDVDGAPPGRDVDGAEPSPTAPATPDAETAGPGPELPPPEVVAPGPTSAPGEAPVVPAPVDPPSVLVVGDSQALAVGGGLAAWADASGAFDVTVVGIAGCSGLIAEGWGVRFDAGESGEMWPGHHEGCALPDLDRLLAVHRPAAVLIAEWGTSTLDHRSPETGEWRSALDADVRAAWLDRYATMAASAAAAGVPTGFVTGPPCGRDAPCSAEGRIEAYRSVLDTTGRPVLDVGIALTADPDRYRTEDGAHVEEGRAAFLLGAEVVAPFVVSLLEG